MKVAELVQELEALKNAAENDGAGAVLVGAETLGKTIRAIRLATEAGWFAILADMIGPQKDLPPDVAKHVHENIDDLI